MDNTTEVFLTLDELNSRQIKQFTAPLIYLFILLIIGIPGNLSVLIIYWNRHGKSVYRTIIWNLALTDFSFCMIAIPFNIGRLIRYYTFTELYVCKVFTTTIVLFIFHSSHLLVILSIHRFRQVCMPMKRQVHVTNVKYLIIGGLCIATFLDIPEFILQPLDEVKLSPNITGYICAVSFKVSPFADLYNGFLVFLFSFYTLLLFVMYSLIGRRMYIQHTMREMISLTSSAKKSRKITKIAITVSVVFALSYVPLWVLKVVAGKIDRISLSDTEFSVLKLFERSYIINHVVNPFIYAFYDKRFRRNFKKIFISMKRGQFLQSTAEELSNKHMSESVQLQ